MIIVAKCAASQVARSHFFSQELCACPLLTRAARTGSTGVGANFKRDVKPGKKLDAYQTKDYM